MPSNHLILCCPLLLLSSIFSSIRVFSNESVLCIRCPKYWSFSLNNQVLPMNIQDWFPLGWTGWISLLSKPNGTHKVLSKIKDLGIPNKVAAAAKSLQSCPTICNPIDRSPPGSSVPGILQARTLECCQNTGNTGLPFPSAVHESEKWKGSHSVVSNS